jgi:hypothetical protein
MRRIFVMSLAGLAACLLAAGCSDGSLAVQSGPDGSALQVATDPGSSGGPCDGNSCIGDWQKDAAEGGAVVQCNDGTWSHAGGLSGSCSDHGGEADGQASSSSQSPSANEPAPGTAATGGPCDGNPCIGDWEKEAAEGGTVVQCNDATWSHAGGISGACSDHGGESSGTPARTAVTTVSTTSGSALGPSNPLPVQCGYGVSGSSGVTCAFAENAFYEYWQAYAGDPTQSESISVWSAQAQQSYSLSCDAGDGLVDCIGLKASGASLDARFTQDAVSAYTDQQAAAYAASGKVGPNTATTTPSSTLTPGDQNPNDANASDCEATIEVGPHSDCFVAQQVANDLAQGTWSAPGSDTVSEGTATITFDCLTIGQDDTQDAQPSIYRCVSQGDRQDWFEFEFT